MTNHIVRLPTGKPLSTTYADHADILSILSTDQRTRGWVYSNFMQVAVEPPGSLPASDCKPDYYRDTCRAWADCPHLIFNMVHPRYVRRFGALVDFLMSCLDEGSYATVYLDMFFVPGSFQYRRSHFAHSVFIHGYDREAGRFLVNFHGRPNGAYSEFSLAFDDLTLAHEGIAAHCGQEYADTSAERSITLHILQFDPRYESFSPTALRKFLTEYLQSTNTHVANGVVDWHTVRSQGGGITDNIYGLATYDTFLWMLEQNLADCNAASLRSVHFLASHKALLSGRILYLHEIGVINSQKIVENAEGIKGMSEILLNLYIACSRRFDNQRMMKCRELVLAIRDRERPLLEELLECIPD